MRKIIATIADRLLIGATTQPRKAVIENAEVY